MKPVLASTLHDPRNRLESLINEQNPKLKELFHEKIVMLSSSTSRETLEILEKLGYEASYGDESVVSTYVIALRRATEKNVEPIYTVSY
jgi:plasmid maintenance system killer protein